MISFDSQAMRSARRLLAPTIIAAVLVLGAQQASAEDDPHTGSSYLTLYPAGDVYQIQVVGDDIAEGLQAGLSDTFKGDPKVQVKPKVASIDQLMRSGMPDQLKGLDDTLAHEQPAVSVVMIGPQDRVSFKGPNGRKMWIDSDEWRAEFGRQIDLYMKVMKRQKQAVYWVSLPNVRRSEPNEDVQILNEIIREKALLNGLKYIDAYAGFIDEGGGYSAMGPDISGKIRLLRESNGVAFTDAGNRKLAHFVEREMRRDLSQAQADRTIPLAGNVAEQQAVSASRLTVQKIVKTTAGDGAQQSPPGVSVAVNALQATAGDQKADSGRINLAIPGSGGKEDIIPVELLRPSIPASVIALVSRKENADKPTQLGDLLIDQIPGGLMVMSSITPANDGGQGDARRRLAPTQTPYFRVMVKGERITPREGRADDLTWPRPEPPPFVEAVVDKPAAADQPPKLARKTPAAKNKQGQAAQ